MESLLLGDANVIIDFAQCHATWIFEDIVGNDVAEILVPQAVIDEVSEEITEEELFDLGVKLAPVSLVQMVEIEQMNSLHNSNADKTLLVLGRDLPGACVWTNDKGLLNECERNGVKTCREFGVVIELARIGIRTSEEIMVVAEAVEKVNPRMKGVADMVRGQLDNMVLSPVPRSAMYR